MMAMGETQHAKNTSRPFHVLAGLSVGLLIICLGAGVVDSRTVEGAPTWAKPAKFALSFAVLFVTLAWLEGRLSAEWRTGRILRVTTLVMGLSMAAEMGYLMYQAGLAEPSHYNYSTSFHTFMYTVVMFLGALLLVSGVGVFAYVVVKDTAANLSPGLRAGVVWGFGLSVVLTVALATYMSGQPNRYVGSPPPDAQFLPVLGWSLDIGDFRPSHFLSLHAMQVLPLLGWGLDRRRSAAPVRHMRRAAALYAALTLGLFVQALAGLPIVAFTA